MIKIQRLIHESNLGIRKSTGGTSWDYYVVKNPNYQIDKFEVKSDAILMDDSFFPLEKVKTGAPVRILSKDTVKHKSSTLAHVKVNDKVGYLRITAISKPIGKTKISATQWEQVITASYNVASQQIGLQDAVNKGDMNKSWNDRLEFGMPTGEKIVVNAFGPNPSGVMKHFGASDVQLTKEWDKYFIETTGRPASSTTRTPKTDMYISKENISLKKLGGSQLMSGGKAETLATLAHAYDNIPKGVKSKAFDAAWDSLSKRIRKDFINIKLPDNASITSIKKDIKRGRGSHLIETIKDGIKNSKELTQTIRELMNDKKVKQAVVNEAMTGKQKFSTKKAISTHMMKFDENGYGEYLKIDKKLISHYAESVTFNVSFKSSGSGKSWLALKGLYKESTEHPVLLDTLIQEAYAATDQLIAFNNILITELDIRVIVKFLSKILDNMKRELKRIFVTDINMFMDLMQWEMNARNPKIQI